MTRFDPDLIAALAEERLDPTEAEALEREISGDPEAAAELAAQRAALAFLHSAPRVSLSHEERMGLRAAVADSIGMSTGNAPTAPARRRRRAPWGAIAVAAASLVAIVAIVPSIGLLTTGGDDTAETTVVAAEIQEQDQEQDAAREPETDLGAGVAESQLDSTPEDGAAFADDAAEAPTVSTETATTTEAAAEELAVPAPGIDPALERLFQADLAPAADESLQACRAEAIDLLEPGPADDLSAIGVSLEEGQGDAVVWFVDRDGRLGEAVAFLVADCSLLATEGL